MLVLVAWWGCPYNGLLYSLYHWVEYSLRKKGINSSMWKKWNISCRLARHEKNNEQIPEIWWQKSLKGPLIVIHWRDDWYSVKICTMQKNMCNMYLNMRNMYMYIAYYDEYMMYIYNVGIQRMGFHHFITLSQVNLLVGSTSLCWVFLWRVWLQLIIGPHSMSHERCFFSSPKWVV